MVPIIRLFGRRYHERDLRPVRSASTHPSWPAYCRCAGALPEIEAGVAEILHLVRHAAAGVEIDYKTRYRVLRRSDACNGDV